MSLDELRKTAAFQNTIDVWIAACSEKNADWYDAERYKKFVSYLRAKNPSLKKFPLCIKEVGGTVERGRDKTAFAESLAESQDPNASAYTLRLSDSAVQDVRNYDPSGAPSGQ